MNSYTIPHFQPPLATSSWGSLSFIPTIILHSLHFALLCTHILVWFLTVVSVIPNLNCILAHFVVASEMWTHPIPSHPPIIFVFFPFRPSIFKGATVCLFFLSSTQLIGQWSIPQPPHFLSLYQTSGLDLWQVDRRVDLHECPTVGRSLGHLVFEVNNPIHIDTVRPYSIDDIDRCRMWQMVHSCVFNSIQSILSSSNTVHSPSFHLPLKISSRVYFMPMEPIFKGKTVR